MNLAGLFAFALISAGAPSGPVVVSSVVGTQPLTATVTNSFIVTNKDSVISSNVFTGGTSANTYQLTVPAGFTALSYSANFPGVLDVSGVGVVTPVGAGSAAVRVLSVGADGVSRGSTVAINPVATAGTYSAGSFISFLPGTLGEHFYGWITNETNAGRGGVVWTNWSAYGWEWVTNSLLYSVTGLTGISWANSSGGVYSPVTAITRRHGYTCGHGALASNVVVRFMGRDGSTNIATATARRVKTPASGEDYCLLVFSADLPAAVEVVKVAWLTNVYAKLPTPYDLVPIPVDRPQLTLETCQHGRIGSATFDIFDGHAMHAPGDSGNPRFVVVSNTIVNFGGTSGTLLSSNFLADLNDLTVGAGLSTNTYQPEILDLSQFPSY